jgi:hypothetical protein
MAQKGWIFMRSLGNYVSGLVTGLSLMGNVLLTIALYGVYISDKNDIDELKAENEKLRNGFSEIEE